MMMRMMIKMMMMMVMMMVMKIMMMMRERDQAERKREKRKETGRQRDEERKVPLCSNILIYQKIHNYSVTLGKCKAIVTNIGTEGGLSLFVPLSPSLLTFLSLSLRSVSLSPSFLLSPLLPAGSARPLRISVREHCESHRQGRGV